MAGKKIKKIVLGMVLCAALAVAAVGVAGYFLTRPLGGAFAQSPNAVEAQEANRKLKLLNVAQSERKQGFVRFSEVEINSFLDGKYHSSDEASGPVRLVKAGVILDGGQFTFVTWHRAPVLGFELPFVWQRVIRPVQGTNGWGFELQSMRVGQVEVPEGHWPRVEKIFGATDALFSERLEWLKELPLVTLASNEQSKSPEVRLYTYLPQEKSKANETAAE